MTTSDAWVAAMRRALELAGAAPRTGDVPIGAVVVDADGQLVGEGVNVRERDGDPTGHAEIVALRAAAGRIGEWRLSGCTLVVTLEPCTMCAGATVLSRVDRLVFEVEVLQHVLGVHDGDDGVEAKVVLHLVVGEKRLGDGRRVCEPGGFDQDAVERVLALEEAAEDADQVAAHGAADAAVIHLEQFLVAGDDELVVDADLAEFVFDHGEFFAVVFREDAIEEGGFAGAEKTGEDGDGNAHEGKRGQEERVGEGKEEWAKQQNEFLRRRYASVRGVITIANAGERGCGREG